MRISPYKNPAASSSAAQQKFMRNFIHPSQAAQSIYTPQLGLNVGMDRHPSRGMSLYRRPDGVSLYRRPDGTSLYLRP